MKRSITKLLCRAGIVAALYAVLTIPLGTLAFGSIGFQIRPAEALTMLPLFYVESIPALYVGCLIANLFTGTLWDVGLGSLASLIAAALTFAAGKLIKNTPLKLIAGGIFPVLVNAFCIPEEGFRSKTIGVVKRGGLDFDAFHTALKANGYEISNGYGDIKSSTFRIGHMGDITPAALEGLIKAMDETLEEMQ